MRINHNISSMVAQGALFGVNRENTKTLEKLSTGLRINRASDDAAGLSVSEQLRTQVRGYGQAKNNAQDGIALLQIAEGAMNQISGILQRMRELAVQSANDTLTSTERVYTDSEYQALESEIDRIANSTYYNGQALMDTTANRFGMVNSTSSVLHIGPNDTQNIDYITVTIRTMNTSGTNGLNLNGSSTTNQANSLSAITSLDTALGTVNRNRSDIGAFVNRLENAVSNIINQEHNTQAAESTIRDTDFAVETARFTKLQILSQSATAMLAQANLVPQSVLGLLGR